VVEFSVSICYELRIPPIAIALGGLFPFHSLIPEGGRMTSEPFSPAWEKRGNPRIQVGVAVLIPPGDQKVMSENLSLAGICFPQPRGRETPIRFPEHFFPRSISGAPQMFQKVNHDVFAKSPSESACHSEHIRFAQYELREESRFFNRLQDPSRSLP
jgi:hypothetical protein